MIPILETHLLDLIEKQIESKNLFEREYIDNDFVCKWDDGRPLKPDYLSKAFKRLLEQNELSVIRLYDLRYSCASLLSEIGYDIKNISEYLGHSNISTTANLYTHIQYKTKVSMGNDIEKAII